MPRRMGALQVRGSQDDAEEIYWMLSEGEEPAEWGNVLLESTFIDQNNPKRQTAGPRRGSPKLDLSRLQMSFPHGEGSGRGGDLPLKE